MFNQFPSLKCPEGGKARVPPRPLHAWKSLPPAASIHNPTGGCGGGPCVSPGWVSWWYDEIPCFRDENWNENVGWNFGNRKMDGKIHENGMLCCWFYWRFVRKSPGMWILTTLNHITLQWDIVGYSEKHLPIPAYRFRMGSKLSADLKREPR